MIRPFTCVCMLLAGASGLYLYQSKHRAHLLDREIARTLRATDATHERIAGLRADHANLTEPQRLAELSRKHLGLQALQPGQFVPVAGLADRLPPPLPPGALDAEDDADPAASPLAEALPPPPPAPRPPAAPVREAARAAPRPPAPPERSVQVASLRPPAAPLAVAPRPPASPAQTAPRPPAAPVREAARPAPRAATATEKPEPSPDAAAPRRAPVQAPVVTAFATPLSAPPLVSPPAVQRVADPAPVLAAPIPAAPEPRQRPDYRPAPGVPAVASALGVGAGRAALPPPVPVAR